MHELSAAAEGLQTALAAYEAALPARRALEDYYESPLWQEDFAADEAGLLPRISAAASSPRTRCLTCWATPTSYTGSSRASRGRPCARTDAVPAPTPAHAIPDPDIVFANEYVTSCSPKKVITAPNITVGD